MVLIQVVLTVTIIIRRRRKEKKRPVEFSNHGLNLILFEQVQ